MFRPVFQTWSLLSPPEVAHEACETLEGTMGDMRQTSSVLRREIQRARVEQRLSIQDLSSRIGLDANILAGYECGEEVLPQDTLHAIARILQVQTGASRSA